MTAKTSLARSFYGELLATRQTAPEHWTLLASARDLVKRAGKKLPTNFNTLTRDRKGRWSGEALHHELYDITPSGTKALVCCRAVEGSKYGVKTLSKNYYLVQRHGKGAIVTEANKAVAAKAAKAAGPVIGYAIEVVTGKARLAGVRYGYKALTTDADGNLVSVWDGSAWPLGKARVEKATEDHTGGFYYYANMAEVLQAANSNDIFGNAREHQNLLIARVEVSGKEYGVSKRCATRMKPVEIVASVLS